MKFKTLTGRLRTVSRTNRYLIDWDAKSKSLLQAKVKAFLREHWRNDVVFEEFPLAGTKMSFDFFNASKKIMIEVQGNQHQRYTPFFHNKNKANFLSQLRRDKNKHYFCELNGISLIEIYPKDNLTADLLK